MRGINFPNRNNFALRALHAYHQRIIIRFYQTPLNI